MKRPRWPRIGALAGVAGVVLVAGFVGWRYFVRSASSALPAPREPEARPAVARVDFVGAERCASCHSTEYAVWKKSTHGRAGGPPSTETVFAPFGGNAIVFANARVTPRIRGGVYEFLVEQRDEPPRTISVDGVVGGGHIYGGGTQGFVTKLEDGTVRFLPFEWSRQVRGWFCNTNSRSGKGWARITLGMRIEECGDWPLVRVLGDNPRYANCQSCHASQASLELDTIARKYATRFTSLAINCESCHGPARRHVELAERGELSRSASVGLASLATLGKDASLRVCYQCHAVKDQLREGFLSGDSLARYYSTKFPLLGDKPLTPDGRVRTFAYQEGHQYSDCYLNGGMTCTSCHDPHSQGYRSVVGEPLQGRFNDKQCTSCHASKADRPLDHTRHPPSVTCTSCHMPSRQEPETRAANAAYARGGGGIVVPYARSDHTISIPRPALDASFGWTSACASCHATMSVVEQERRIRDLWGELKPINAVVAAQLRVRQGAQPSESSAALWLGDPRGDKEERHAFARFAGVSDFLETYVRVDVGLDPDVERRLKGLASSSDVDIRAAALAALHLAQGDDRATLRTLATALRSERDHDDALRSRWAVALGFMADRYAANGNLADAVTAYTRALDVLPTSARLLLSRANAQRDAGDLEGAIGSYRRSIALERGNPLTWVNFGIALSAAGDSSNAVTALTNAATLNPAEPLAWFNLGNIAFVRGDLSRAATLYERTAKLDPSIVLAHFQLARVNLMKKDYREALANLRRGLAFDSSDASARGMVADLERRLGGGTARP